MRDLAFSEKAPEFGRRHGFEISCDDDGGAAEEREEQLANGDVKADGDCG